jgi:DNA-binding CsgD family transcriptional regulator
LKSDERRTDGTGGAPGLDRLTPRERQVLQLVAEGRSNKEVAAILGISTKTAETHRGRVMAKLDLHSMNELVRYAIRTHLIEP